MAFIRIMRMIVVAVLVTSYSTGLYAFTQSVPDLDCLECCEDPLSCEVCTSCTHMCQAPMSLKPTQFTIYLTIPEPEYFSSIVSLNHNFEYHSPLLETLERPPKAWC